MKKQAKRFVALILGSQVRRLQKHNKFTVIAVVGSIGKTSTKFAIANALSSKKAVRWQQGNYNDLVTVPLVFFGHKAPNIYNPFAWLSIFIQNELELMYDYQYDYVVVELGTDAPGQIAEFKDYLKIDITVITAIAPEHMEYFKTIEAVAKEELSVAKFSKELVINTDLVDNKYVKSLKKTKTTYGSKGADYILETEPKLLIRKHKKSWLDLGTVHSRAEAFSKTAAAVLCDQAEFDEDEIQEAISGYVAAPGRMQLLDGVNDSIIIDDTYNASPDACIAALHTLYQRSAKHKIAMLGNMNELGAHSEKAHKDVGAYCDPKQLDLVVTLGPDANKYLAPAAEAKGCTVKTFDSPYELGKYVKKHIQQGSLILAKGSQNNVYMEEAVKTLLAHDNDDTKLVRQSPSWLKKKQKNFQHV